MVFMKDLKEELQCFASSHVLSSEADTGSKC